jgi:hypothetical protein
MFQTCRRCFGLLVALKKLPLRLNPRAPEHSELVRWRSSLHLSAFLLPPYLPSSAYICFVVVPEGRQKLYHAGSGRDTELSNRLHNKACVGLLL